MHLKLTTHEHHQMHRDGWCLALRFAGLRLEPAHGAGRFKDDACVWLHVFDLALERDPLATKVLAILEALEPLEFQAIARYCAVYRPAQCAHLRAAA